MWQVLNSPVESARNAEIVLRKELFGQGLPKGRPGDIKPEFAFYQLENGKENFITAEMSGHPVLIAVTEEQLKSWKNRKIIAKPVNFVWE